MINNALLSLFMIEYPIILDKIASILVKLSCLINSMIILFSVKSTVKSTVKSNQTLPSVVIRDLTKVSIFKTSE
jgi:hypothetical protein